MFFLTKVSCLSYARNVLCHVRFLFSIFLDCLHAELTVQLVYIISALTKHYIRNHDSDMFNLQIVYRM